MPAALRVAGGLGVGAIFALRFCKAFREKLHPAPFLFDRAGSKGNRSPAADSAAGDQRQTSNFRHHVTVFHPSPLHALRRPPAAGRRCGRKRGRGQGRVEPLGGRQNLHFQVVLGKSKSSFPPPPFFSQPMRQAAGLPTGSRLPAGTPLPPSVFPQYSPTQPYLALSLQGAVVIYIDISLGHYGMNLTAPFFLPQPLTRSPPAPIAVLSAPSASRTGTGSRSVGHERPVCAHGAPFFALLSGRL